MNQEFFIIKNATLPYLRMELINDGRSDFLKTDIINKSFMNINQNLTESEIQFRNLSNELLTYLHHKLSQKSNNSSFTIPSSNLKFLTQISSHNNTKHLTNTINTFVEHIINELKGTIYETFFNAYSLASLHTVRIVPSTGFITAL